MEEGLRRFTRTDAFELAAIAVLAPVAWLTPERWAWWPISRVLSRMIARGRPGVTELRVAMLREALGARADAIDLDQLRVDVMATYMEERLQILRAYRPRGWRPRLTIEGAEHLDAAVAAGAGAVLWTAPFSYADLVVKMALDAHDYAVIHLSAFSRGFSPNSCWDWARSTFGMKVLSPLRTRVEDRFLCERITIPLNGGLAHMRALEQCLRIGGFVSIRAGDAGQRALAVPFLDGTIRLATGPASLALATGAPLLPVDCIRRGPGDFTVVIDPPLRPRAGHTSRNATDDLVRAFGARLERWVLRQPHLWSGWYRMPSAGAPVSEDARLAG
jgi:KDO2-lipid IV(A) lauroyltransferase